MGQDCSQPSESSNDDSVSDIDSVGIELSKLSTLELEELDLCLEPARTMGLEWQVVRRVCWATLCSIPSGAPICGCGHARSRRKRCARTVNIIISCTPVVAILIEPVSVTITHHMSCITLSFALGGSLISSSAEYSHHPTVNATLGCVSKGLGSMPEQPSCDCIESQL